VTLIGEYLGCLLTQRVRVTRIVGYAARCRLRTADNHHEQFVGADQCDRRPRGHHRTCRHVPSPWATLAASVAAMPGPRSHRANAGTGVFRRAKSSITIELA
jgi:hypothetical protein